MRSWGLSRLDARRGMVPLVRRDASAFIHVVLVL